MSVSVTLRADAAPGMGTGHVMRCLALALAARDQGASVRMAGRVTVSWVREKLAGEGIAFAALPGDIRAAEDPDELLAHLAGNGGGEWVVLDGYHFGLDCQQAVCAAGYRLLVVDDYAHLPEYCCDILLNQSMGAEAFAYAGRIGARLLGPGYALLRPEFSAARERAKARLVPEKTRAILLTLGGGDGVAHLARIAPAFTLPDLAGRVVRVIAGAMPHERIRELLRDCPARVEILGRVDDMPSLLLDTDLCVTAGGSTCWEACCLGVPFLTVAVAENQRAIVRELRARRIAAPFSPAAFRALLDRRDARRKRAAAGLRAVDGRGTHKTLAALCA